MGREFQVGDFTINRYCAETGQLRYLLGGPSAPYDERQLDDLAAVVRKAKFRKELEGDKPAPFALIAICEVCGNEERTSASVKRDREPNELEPEGWGEVNGIFIPAGWAMRRDVEPRIGYDTPTVAAFHMLVCGDCRTVQR